METTTDSSAGVRAGDSEGLGSVYSESGDIVLIPDEEVLKTSPGWDIDVTSPWRKILPKLIFAGFGGKASSELYITNQRIVLVREIDLWRELKEELSPLGVPSAAAKEIHLRRLKSAGARQFCEIKPRNFRVVRMKRLDRRWSWLDLRLLDVDDTKYEITFAKTDGLDSETLTLIQAQFLH